MFSLSPRLHGVLWRFRGQTGFHNGSVFRNSVPLWSNVFLVTPASRCSMAVSRSGRIPQRQRFPQFSASVADGREAVGRRLWEERASGTCVSCSAILQCPAYHQNLSRLLSIAYVLTICWTWYISPPNGHSAPYIHMSSRCLSSEYLITRRFYESTLLDS